MIIKQWLKRTMNSKMPENCFLRVETTKIFLKLCGTVVSKSKVFVVQLGDICVP